FLQRAGLREILHQHQQSQTPEVSPKCDVWDGLVWRRFTGTRNINEPHSCPFLIEARECLCCRNNPWYKGAKFPSIELPINATQQELKELWQGYHFSPTSTGPSGSFIRVALRTAIADVVAMRKLTGFISHSGNHFCNFCTIHKAQIEKIGPQFHYTRSYQNDKSTIAKWLRATPQQRQAIFSEYVVRYSILEDLPYWEETRMVNLDIMHN
ncbi:hypothetical protein O181_133765, partial [Austropuccinia psidii MF-1]|nr:hypothetical protein [Austropuccinia psidii MF-1]